MAAVRPPRINWLVVDIPSLQSPHRPYCRTHETPGRPVAARIHVVWLFHPVRSWGRGPKRPAIVETRYWACQGKTCPQKRPGSEATAAFRVRSLPIELPDVFRLSYKPEALRDGESRPVSLSRVAVREDDDRQPALREAGDRVAEPHGLAGVPDRVPRDPPTEAVPDCRVVGGRRRREREPARARAQEPVIAKRGIPFREVADRRVDASIAEDRARRALVRALPGAVHFAIAICPVVDGGDSLPMRDAPRHAERPEDALEQEFGERSTGCALDDEREQGVATVAVAIRRARREIRAVPGLQ